MTMMMESPPSKREALRTSRSERLAAAPEGQRMSRRVRLEKERAASSRVMEHSKAPSTRGLTLAKTASARWNTSRNSSRNMVLDEEYSEELVVDMEDTPTPSRRTRGLPRRTASMDGTNDSNSQRPLRRPLQRNKSCDGSTMPHQRVLRRTMANHAALDRASSVRRFNTHNSNRRLLDRAKSERHMDSRRLAMDNSSDDGARSSRRRHRLDDSSARRRQGVSSRSMSGSSNGGGSTRRRKPRSTDGSSGLMKDHSEDSHGGAVMRGKGLDDSSRRRKEPTLSKLSINELRNRLVGDGTAEADCEVEGCDDDENDKNHDSIGSSLGCSGNDSFREQPNWEFGNDAGPLHTDLNDDA